MGILIAWRKLNNKSTILCYGQEIIWNNTHKGATPKSFMYTTGYDLGIKRIKDLYDYNEKGFYSFGKLRGMSRFSKISMFRTKWSKQLESKS